MGSPYTSTHAWATVLPEGPFAAPSRSTADRPARLKRTVWSTDRYRQVFRQNGVRNLERWRSTKRPESIALCGSFRTLCGGISVCSISVSNQRLLVYRGSATAKAAPYNSSRSVICIGNPHTAKAMPSIAREGLSPESCVLHQPGIPRLPSWLNEELIATHDPTDEGGSDSKRGANEKPVKTPARKA